jgi:hypothetical protein
VARAPGGRRGVTPRRRNASAEPLRSSADPAADDRVSHTRALVRLRAFSPVDAAWLDGWLGAVAAGVGYEAIDHVEPSSSLIQRLRDERWLCARIIEREGVDAGIVLYRAHEPRQGDGMFELVAAPAGEARWGSGMMGATVAEREMLELGVRTVYAPAPEVHGIAVYFWIRLGYAPLQRAEWPCERAGTLWLRRDLTPALP